MSKCDVKVKDSTLEGNAIGDRNNVTNIKNTTNQRGIHKGDNYYGNHITKAGRDIGNVKNYSGGTHNKENHTRNVSGGVVGTVGRSSGSQYFGQSPARSENPQNTRNQISTQERENESLPVAREVEEAVEAIYAYECDECRRREMCRSTIACLKGLGVFELSDLDLFEEAELEQRGIKLVQARKLKGCKVGVSAEKVPVKSK